jgi:hypothetical protein
MFFPVAASRDLQGGPSRNFQVLGVLDFLAELTQHIPDKHEHLLRFYGWYSHRRRGIRAKLEKDEHPVHDHSGDQPPDSKPLIDRSAIATAKADGDGPRGGSLSNWAMLIKRIYEVDPLECAKCGGEMEIISFIERDQRSVINRCAKRAMKKGTYLATSGGNSWLNGQKWPP